MGVGLALRQNPNVCVYFTISARDERPRLRVLEPARRLRVEPLVVDDPQVRALGDGVAQAQVEVDAIGRRVVLHEGIRGGARVQGRADTEARELDIGLLVPAPRIAAA